MEDLPGRARKKTLSGQTSGLVYNIQKFAIHDGPGIRTLVYMKGCPLNCLWCSSPQSQKPCPEIMYLEVNCKKCGRCVEACPQGAMSLSEEGIQINRELCTNCGLCAERCLNGALDLVGKKMSVEELFQEVKGDSGFYRRSGGGVTVGGGEPTMQYKYVSQFLKQCQAHYLHTAIETCGYASWDHLRLMLEGVDLVYFDIKHMDSKTHKKITGVSNRLILANARKIAQIRPLIIRIPLVPGCNDSEKNILATAGFAAKLGKNLLRIELLPYHKYGTQTYARIGREYPLKGLEPPAEGQMEKLKKLIESCGIRVQVGG